MISVKRLLPLFVVLMLSMCVREKREVISMKIESNDFEDGGFIPSEFTCDGKDINPHLKWSDFPDETEAFALTCIDPDAPGGDFIHWLVYNIPADVTEISKGGSVLGKEVENDFGKTEYGGPCPPSGTHRYFFTIYALDQRIEGDLNKGNFRQKVEEHTIARAEIMCRYARK